MRKKVLCIIPARSNSKGIPSKNIQKVFGKPLIEYTINTAKKSRLVTRIIVSTDSQEIANVAIKLECLSSDGKSLSSFAMAIG